MRDRGRISPARAARLMGVHYNTVYKYCRKAVAGSPTRLKSVRQDPENGYYSIDLDEVLAHRSGVKSRGGSIL